MCVEIIILMSHAIKLYNRKFKLLQSLYLVYKNLNSVFYFIMPQ
jgi:hypothetical protein